MCWAAPRPPPCAYRGNLQRRPCLCHRAGAGGRARRSAGRQGRAISLPPCCRNGPNALAEVKRLFARLEVGPITPEVRTRVHRRNHRPRARHRGSARRLCRLLRKASAEWQSESHDQTRFRHRHRRAPAPWARASPRWRAGAGIACCCSTRSRARLQKWIARTAAMASMAQVAKDRLDAGRARRHHVAKFAPWRRSASLRPSALVIEAIVEDHGARSARCLPNSNPSRRGAILATNTSSLSVTAIARDLARPARLARHALLQSGAGDEACRDRLRPCHRAARGRRGPCRSRHALGQDGRACALDAGLHRQPHRPAVLRRGARAASGKARQARRDRRLPARGRFSHGAVRADGFHRSRREFRRHANRCSRPIFFDRRYAPIARATGTGRCRATRPQDAAGVLHLQRRRRAQALASARRRGRRCATHCHRVRQQGRVAEAMAHEPYPGRRLCRIAISKRRSAGLADRTSSGFRSPTGALRASACRR